MTSKKCDKSNIYQINVVLKVTFKRFQRSLIEAYNTVERRVELNNRTSYHRNILVALADNIGLIKS